MKETKRMTPEKLVENIFVYKTDEEIDNMTPAEAHQYLLNIIEEWNKKKTLKNS